MVRIRQTIEIQAPADDVWRFLGRPERIAEFHPHILDARVDGDLRRCTLTDGSEVIERIVERSIVHRFYTYELAAEISSLRRYRACLAVRGHGDHSHVDWDAELEPRREADSEPLAAAFAATLADGLEQLRLTLGPTRVAA
jgi:uncharacterized protein YndB with AHSA1/START domain